MTLTASVEMDLMSVPALMTLRMAVLSSCSCTRHTPALMHNRDGCRSRAFENVEDGIAHGQCNLMLTAVRTADSMQAC